MPENDFLEKMRAKAAKAMEAKQEKEDKEHAERSELEERGEPQAVDFSEKMVEELQAQVDDYDHEIEIANQQLAEFDRTAELLEQAGIEDHEFEEKYEAAANLPGLLEFQKQGVADQLNRAKLSLRAIAGEDVHHELEELGYKPHEHHGHEHEEGHGNSHGHDDHDHGHGAAGKDWAKHLTGLAPTSGEEPPAEDSHH